MHQNQQPRLTRRRLLAAGGACALAAPAWAQRPAPIVITQLFDGSPREQDVAKDFLVGSRAAWQEINSQGGVRGRPVVHHTVEVDGSQPEAVRQALRGLKDTLVLCGTVSDPLAAQVTTLLAQESPGIAQAAPWLQNSSQEIGDATFPIFAGRREQIAHALKSLSVMGIRDVGAVFAAPRNFALYREDVTRIAADLKLALSHYQADGDLARLGQRLGPGSPALLLFVGGTPELVQFTQGLQRQARQRYVIALADVNLQTVHDMGASKATPVIATQAVPMANAPLPVVRRYREALARLFDEPPAALSLAGYLAARYAYEVLADAEGPLTRASALAAFRRRGDVDLGGYRVRFDASRRSTTFVTQSMLTPDGRVVG